MNAHEAYQRLGEAEAVRVAGKVTARHPAAFPLDGLLLLERAADRYGHLIRNHELVSFATWADRIDADALASIDPDRGEITAALRAMHQAAQPATPVASLLDRLLRLRREPAIPGA